MAQMLANTAGSGASLNSRGSSLVSFYVVYGKKYLIMMAGESKRVLCAIK